MTKAEQAAAKWSREYRVRHSQKDSLAWRYPLDEADLDSAFLAGAAWQREEDAKLCDAVSAEREILASIADRHGNYDESHAHEAASSLVSDLAAAIRNQQEEK